LTAESRIFTSHPHRATITCSQS